MKRRKFLKLAAPVPLLLNAIQVKAFESLGLMQALECGDVQNRCIVVIQMRGGNDGLNTIIPVDAYGTYAGLRPNIKIPDSGANAYIPLDTTLTLADQVGLNPGMSGIKALYDQGKATIIQGVSYPTHNRSHFKSTDLMLTGGDGQPANFNIPDGWMGRYLKYNYPNAIGTPSPIMPDPVGIQLGNKKPSLGFHSLEEHALAINLSGQDPAGFFTLVSQVGLDPIANIPMSHYGDKLDYIQAVEEDSEVYAERISGVFNNGRNSVSANYPDTYLANQLKTVARLLNGGSKTKIFLVDMTGFDTHVNQIGTNAGLGSHFNLLTMLSEGVKAFQDDLAAMALDDRVMTVTFSEFGRKATENANRGTDHGTLSPMMVFGKHLDAGVKGTNLDLTTLDNGAPLGQQHDYRAVFTELLHKWLGADDGALIATGFLPYKNSGLDLISSTQVADPTCAPLPETSNGLGDPNQPHVFNIAVPIAGAVLPLDEPLVEITDCNYVVLAPGFVAPTGSNVLIYPGDCETASPLSKQAIADSVTDETTIPQDEFDQLKVDRKIQNLKLEALEAYPNPFIDHLNVSFRLEDGQEKVQLALVDMQGRVVDFSIAHSFYRDNYYSFRLKTDQIKAGTYFALVRTEKGSSNFQVVKSPNNSF
ncbi:MAG: DUF1501 domain-containing protein [Lewinella sp.]